MDALYERSKLLLGEEGVARIARAHVAVFGLGGVGGACAEALARGGVGALTLVDEDVFTESNLNRQLGATRETLGQPKAAVTRARVLAIHPACRVTARVARYAPETAGDFPLAGLDYIVDAIDTVTAKLTLIERARAAGVPLISCMGTGNKLDPTRFEAADLYATSVCPLARVMRAECKKRGIDALRVVYSREIPRKLAAQPCEHGRHPPGSVSFVPPVAGMVLAGEVLRFLAGEA